jgi:hypothetical protein
MIGFFVALTLFIASGAWMTYRENGWTWTSGGLLAIAVILGVGSIIESFVLRIELTDDAMIVTELHQKKRYAMSVIDRIEEARGVPPSLRLADGTWVKLPSVANDLGNSVRAWLKAGRAGTNSA